MDFKYFAIVLVCCAAVASCIEGDESLGVCRDLSCAPREVLLEQIRQLQQSIQHERRPIDPQSVFSTPVRSVFGAAANPTVDPNTCNICSSNPCLNNGTCQFDPKNPFNKYICNCPDNTSGKNCENIIICDNKSCGSNAICQVINHQKTCTCKPGFSGNPKYPNGCTSKIAQACMNGDPHYQTFDSLYYDYQGTCPYFFSFPCRGLDGGYDNYTVKAKNELLSKSSHVSSVMETEVVMFNNTIHIDASKNTVVVNGYIVHVPFYWPSADVKKISITYTAGSFYVKNVQDSVTVVFSAGNLCIQVPDIPYFRGNETLCGLAGNLDGNYKNDITESNGTVFPVTRKDMSGADSNTRYMMTLALDTWMTNDFYVKDPTQACVPGHVVYNTTKCDSQDVANQCKPILDAMNATGPFAQCQNLGSETITQADENCIYDVCAGADICGIFNMFAHQCMNYLPNTDLGNWRSNPAIGCQLTCPANSHYSSCMSSCPASCADQSSPDFCDRGCTDGCECDYGYVLDTTQLGQVTCVPVEQCGCLDDNGNMHPPNTPWLTDDCVDWNTCRNGTHVSKYMPCDENAYCGIDNNWEQACICKPGFTGDGYNCTDINECLDSSTCHHDTNAGNCTNTPGSYYCSCNHYFNGNDCEYYLPRRHCADLFHYWGYTNDGVYTLNPPYVFNGHQAYSNYSVYCNMKLENGGFTMMSSDSEDVLVGKSYADYTAGFGNPSTQSVWLGLDLISGMTNEVSTSLRVDLFRCASNGLPPETTDCTYRLFTVRDSSSNYAVDIPEYCTGTEQHHQDGWVRWNQTTVFPQFIAVDNDNSEGSCSSHFQKTGWWFDTTTTDGAIRCGVANLNGVRFSCDDIPYGSDEDTYLRYNAELISQAWLYLRPSQFPNYDPRPVTPCRDENGALALCPVY